MNKNRSDRTSKKNITVVVLTVVVLGLLVAAIGFFIGFKLLAKADKDSGKNASYMIVVNDNITAYDGDEQLLTPHIVDAKGNVLRGRFSYAIVGAATAPISVSEAGVVTVNEDGDGTTATVEITELNTGTKASVNINVMRTLSGIKGVMFGDDLVVATSAQELVLGDDYTVTVKTVPSNAVLKNDQLTIKTVDKYGKEVKGVLDYSVVPGTNRIKISPVGLGSGTMVFSVTANGKELCKDEEYLFSVSMRSDVLNGALTDRLKQDMSYDPVAREKIELIPSDVLGECVSIDIPEGTDSLHGVKTELFSKLETVVFTSVDVMQVDGEVSSDIIYRVRNNLLASYAADEFWKDYIYNIIPYENNAQTEKWAVYHYYDDPYDKTDPKIAAEQIVQDYTLKTFAAFGYANDYYYVGKDPKPQTDDKKQSATSAVLSAVQQANIGLHIEVGYTPNTYTVKYVVQGGPDVTACEATDPEVWTYGVGKTLYTAQDIKEATGVPVERLGYKLVGWLTNPAAPDSLLNAGEQYVNLAAGGTVTLYAHWMPYKYTIVFRDTTLDNLTVEYGSTFTMPNATKTGHTLINYTDVAGNIYLAGESYNNLVAQAGLVELTAHFQPITYTVKFERNGGSWLDNTGEDSVILTYGIPYKLKVLNQTGKSSYVWRGIDSSGNQVDWMAYDSNDEIKNLSDVNGAVVTLKAFWNPIKYTIVYSFADFSYTYKTPSAETRTVTGTHTQERLYGDKIALIKPTRTGYTATKWLASYYTDKGSSTHHSLNDQAYSLGDTEDLISGKTNEDGRTYYFVLSYSANTYTVSFNYDGATTAGQSSKSVTYNATYGSLPTPIKYGSTIGSRFDGWYYNNTLITSSSVMKVASSHTLVARWTLMPISATVSSKDDLSDIKKGGSESATVKVTGGSGSYSYSATSGSGDGYSWSLNTSTGVLKVSVSKKDKSGTIKITVTDTVYGTTATISKSWSSEACVAAGTLITLADGSQKPVEQLTGDEMLLVWNFFTGTFDVAPILCIDSDAAGIYEVITLHFSDGADVKIITEHGFFDVTLGKYVYLDRYADRYIGHVFNKQIAVDGKLKYTEVTLDSVTITDEYTTAWSPVTYSFMCIYVNGMLSMPAGIDGLFNIFEVNTDTMCYDVEDMERDIELYGLFTYEELTSLIPIPEELFEAVPCKYLKVAIGKGLVTVEELQAMFEQYAELLGM